MIVDLTMVKNPPKQKSSNRKPLEGEAASSLLHLSSHSPVDTTTNSPSPTAEIATPSPSMSSVSKPKDKCLNVTNEENGFVSTDNIEQPPTLLDTTSVENNEHASHSIPHTGSSIADNKEQATSVLQSNESPSKTIDSKSPPADSSDSESNHVVETVDDEKMPEIDDDSEAELQFEYEDENISAPVRSHPRIEEKDESESESDTEDEEQSEDEMKQTVPDSIEDLVESYQGFSTVERIHHSSLDKKQPEDPFLRES